MRYAHVVAHLGKDGRFDKLTAAALRQVRRLAAQTAHSALGASDLDVLEDFLVLGRGGHGTDLRRLLLRIADARCLREGDQPINELVVDGVLDQQTRACNTGLPRRCEDARDRTLHGVVEVRIGEHDVGRLPAELQRDMLEVARSRLVDVAPAALAAREGDLRDLGMLDQRCAHLGAEARHHIQDAWREASHVRETSQFDGGGRRELRRLENECVAGREAGCQLVHREQQRRVPRRDRNTDAERLVARVVERVGLVDRQHSAFDLVRQSAEVAEILGQVAHLRAHLRDQLAVVAHFNPREPFRVALDQVRQAEHEQAASACRQLRPRAVQRLVCRLDRAFRVGLLCARHRCPHLAGVRVGRLKRLPVNSVHGLAVDEHVIGLYLVGAVHAFFLCERGRADAPSPQVE